MAEGGVTMDKSPSPAKMEWANENPVGATSQMTRSLTDHLQRLLAIKQITKPGADDFSGISSIDQCDSSTQIQKLLTERDEMWREHERSQIAFMEREHERMVQGLHNEIERLQTKCSDLTRSLAEALTTIEILSYERNKESVDTMLAQKLEKELKSASDELTKLRELNERKQEKLQLLEDRCEEQELRYKEEIEHKNKHIEEISADLDRKAAVVAQLTTQLHQLRLKEAVEKQRYEQRRQMAEQQWKRRQALAAASKTDAPSNRSIPSSETAPPAGSRPGKVTIQVAAEPVPLSSHRNDQHRGMRRPGARLVSATASASPPPSARRTQLSALPSIMTTSTPAASTANKDQGQRKPGNATARACRSSTTAGKPPVE